MVEIGWTPDTVAYKRAIHIKTDFHAAFLVARATAFLLFKLNSFPLHSTQKLRRQKKRDILRQKNLNGNPPLVS